MKMKNLLIGGMSLALVACISIGGTLAYLTDTDEKAVNTFKFANALEVQLTEAVPDSGLGNASATSNSDGSKGVTYTNVVVNQTLPKEPKIQLTKSTVDTYVFAKIENKTSGMVTVGTVDEKVWTSLGTDTQGNAIYGRLVEVPEGGSAVVDTPTALFSTVTVVDQPTSGQDLGAINIYVSAIQKEGFKNMKAALSAVTEWQTSEVSVG